MIMASKFSGRMSKIADNYIYKKKITPAQQFLTILQKNKKFNKNIFKRKRK